MTTKKNHTGLHHNLKLLCCTKMKDPQNGRKYLQIVYLIRNWYWDHIKDTYNNKRQPSEETAPWPRGHWGNGAAPSEEDRLTRAGPTPTNISKNSEPLTVMKGTLASPAVALASSVFPVPGGPVRMAPFRFKKEKVFLTRISEKLHFHK